MDCAGHLVALGFAPPRQQVRVDAAGAPLARPAVGHTVVVADPPLSVPGQSGSGNDTPARGLDRLRRRVAAGELGGRERWAIVVNRKSSDTPFLGGPDTLEARVVEHPFPFRGSPDQELNALILEAGHRT